MQNKHIVIIGGTTGIGFSAARAFIEMGAKVVITGRDEQHVKDAQKILGKNVYAVVADATENGSAVYAIDECIKQFGSFTGLYHVAGGSGRKFGDGPLHELTREGWDQTLQWNLTSLMLSNQAAVRQFMKQQTGGTILNMGSVLGFSPAPEFFSTHAYAAAKAAIIGFSKSVAAYYATQNIRVNVVAPALVETPMAARARSDENILNYIKKKQPLDGGRIGQPEDVDGIAIYFMSDASKFTTGQVVAVDGGWSLI